MTEEKKPKQGVTPVPKSDRKDDRKAEEVLREQAKTEIEKRPYLDTEGGE